MQIRFNPPVPAVYTGTLKEHHGPAFVEELRPDGSFILTLGSGVRLRGVRPQSFRSMSVGIVDYTRNFGTGNVQPNLPVGAEERRHRMVAAAKEAEWRKKDS